jgi:predicted acylesterase/phospholipase RssA
VQTSEPPKETSEKAPPKLGLALSGGGFRAAFFHVGVLARLAELGVLRRVEVISTVSGGSIVGALYYVRLRTLLQNTPDEEITDDHYVGLVDGLEKEFLAGVQRNIRARVLWNPAKNVWMALSQTYSRSDRIGDLYDSILYKGAWPEDRPPRQKWPQFIFKRIEKQIELRELCVIPPEGPSDFSPTTGNPSRKTKVPALVMNASSLNTGHSWCFEVVRMGEAVPYLGLGADDIDVNLRLEQGALLPVDSPNRIAHQDDFPLGLAVAASAGVPALFHPLAVSKLYGKDWRVELVDGGVHDNQGVQALLDKQCNRFIISDASGQLGDEPQPATRVPGVGGRSMGIYGDSLRDEQLLHMLDRGAEEARDQPVALMHLRKGLPRPTRKPKLRGEAVAAATAEADAETGITTADFGVDEEAQLWLARIRTDLDAFSDIEAQSLMVDGYLMTAESMRRQARLHDLLGGTVPPAPVDSVPEHWDFHHAAELIAPGSPAWYLKRLRIGRERFLKPARLVTKWVWLFLAVALLVALAALEWWVLEWRHDVADWLDGSWAITHVLAIVGALLLLAVAYLIERPRIPVVKQLLQLLGSVLLPLLVALPAVIFAIATYLTGRLHVRLGKLPR